MEQVLLTEQTILPSLKMNSVASAESNYVNFLSISSTKNTNALIDILQGVIIYVEDSSKKE